MHTIRIRRMTVIGLGVSLCFTLSAVMTEAQGRRGNGPGGPGRAIPGGEFGNVQNRPTNPMSVAAGRNASGPMSFAAGQNANGGQRPFVEGTIVQGDANTGRILLQSQRDGANRVVQITNNTQIVTQVAAQAATLQVGDRIQLPDGPRGNNSSTAGIGTRQSNGTGQNNTGVPPRQGGRGPGGMPSMQSAGQSGGNSGGAGPRTAQVTSLSPLSVTFDNGVSVPLNLAAETPVMKIQPIAFSNLNVGDRVMVMGQTTSDGICVATTMAVNMPMGPGSGSGGAQGTAPNNAPQNGSGSHGRGGPRSGGRPGGPGSNHPPFGSA